MPARLRRFVLLVTAALWQGGFVFYAGVVVPVGTELHGHFGQGLVTQRVTNALNLFGLLCHVAYFWELLATKSRRWKWGLWAVSLAMLNALALMHLKMDSLIDAEGRRVADGFRGWHIAYLWLSTGQWLIAGVLGWAAVGSPRPWGRGARGEGDSSHIPPHP
jgi:hypothetical protein